MFARGAYTSEILATREEMIAAENRLRANLGGHELRDMSRN
ncbi:hypothetical protein [Novosphingobium album (ex Liu et al. 2023)]|uniref:Uncharacterized protein n=1 Tax=Novosphingobium album (ex Liu et al. 2023) TaxID=3031130 RepID=A0ABT5WQ21_9SPHN|nr:hypothetical protein [Novosphingobium album (ex Liu et al. 2023)]MDE8652142.1 hypothetical protein [Novosphingobium album (ex Liu et al. 2023)]